MKDLPLRRGQLVTTFGPGSLVISPEGESAMIGSLDKWYHDKNEKPIDALDEFEIQEPRLRSILKVDKLLMPPDYRPGYKYKNAGDALTQTNTDIYIPLLRFPTWHYCPVCKTLQQSEMSNRTSWLDCKVCKDRRKMIQVPFVTVCNQGHISDFPWREWVHKDEDTRCEGLMRLTSTGGATLDSLKVKCSCNKERSLRGIMTRRNDSNHEEEGISELSKRLNENGNLYQCKGHKPWYGSLKDNEKCTSYPVAVLKNSINVYYPNTISAIYLPGENPAVERLINMFERNGITSSWLKITDEIDKKIEIVKKMCPPEIQEFKKSDIELAILYIEGELDDGQAQERIHSKNTEKELRKKEFETLVNDVVTENLKVRHEWRHIEGETKGLATNFALINRVTKLKETIALTGFNRLSTNDDESSKNKIENGKRLLFKDPELIQNKWLPAYKVYGEGIFFTLNTEKLRSWEESHDVQRYFNKLLTRVERSRTNIDESILSPRNILMHTLSHIIIDELALTCGYNSASIRERLYIDDEQCGILIYTSSGDIDGTFGGLVRMGKTKNFFPVVDKAIDKARWCSSDPVCSEIGKSSGQGVNNLNGAACHSCTYLPETSCELGNLFLDRTLLIDSKIGFFK
ncbi:protein of unknown function [Salinibacillus kushneri]|uniref:MrfA-like Zn-binding domain-containing protein n=1 Tax=Salinibacillus kushneri TaxID=237682 RepID=A0A1I0A3F8_9BACI|nr:DUF1998 domain-containing protein [Salinibacillus kushneri]SES88506.1 protein of unknown function [Salinibacillus kushneri]